MKLWMILVLCVVVCTLLSPTHSQGVRSSLDFGWKFMLHPQTNSCSSANPFPINMNGMQCYGLSQVTAATSPQECELACCGSLDCSVWQWCLNSSCSPVKSCWVGQLGDCSKSEGWQSAAANVEPPPTYTNCTEPECQVKFNDSNWRTLSVPHDFVVEGTFTPEGSRSHGYLPTGTAWYRLHFTIPSTAKGQAIWIQFDGVYRNSATYLNGQFIGNHPSGYTSFIYDISNSTINFGGDNVLAVYVDSSQFEGWWYEGGGIYRHVWLTIADPLHIVPWGFYAPSTITGEISNVGQGQFATEAVVYFETQLINNRATTQSINVVNVVQHANGTALASVATPITLASKQQITVTQSVVVQNVNLWSAESPYLYTVTTSLMVNTVAVDRAITNIGIRKVVFDVDQGLFINNNHVKINGVCNHQDFAGVGTAVPDRVNLFRVQKLKEMGVNGWRMSHNPPNPELLDFTDRYGIYVMDENRNFANVSQYFSDARLMVVRDRNHPSVIMWSVCNEGGCMEGDPNGANVGAEFKSIILSEDPFRPVVAAMNGDWGIGLSYVLDAQGINYNYGEYPTYHATHPYQPMFGSETASCTGARGVYVTNSTAAELAIYNADQCMQTWVNAVQTTPYIAGGFAWTGFDYKGEPTPYNWPEINSNFGTIDIAGFPKDTFYYYQSWYTNQTVLHLLPHWNWPQGQTNVAVWAYTNAPFVELFVNGASYGVQNVPYLGRAGWTVNYVAGSITAKAYAANKTVIATQEVVTAGAPSSISLSLDTSNTIKADGHDVALVAVSILDSKGNFVPTATNYVSFSVTGGVILGVGNGDPACHEPDKASGRSAFGGLARVVVQSIAGAPGTITLTASSSGLQSAKIAITAV